MPHSKSKDSHLDKARAEASRICSARAAGKPGGTCWNGEGTVRRKQPWMMGQGSGFNQICFGPDQTTSRGRRPQVDDDEEREPRESSKVKPLRTKKQIEQSMKLSLARRVVAGNACVGFRIYLIQWQKKKWWERMINAGGMPDGMDIAHSEFGDLLMVPVNELDFLEREAPDEPLVDREGRKFWVAESTKDFVARIFGAIRWSQPLTMAELNQFGVRLVP